MSLESPNLRAFLRVAERGSVSAAAKPMHLTQSALSRRIQQLESEVGEALFIRTGRGLRLTQTGERLARHAGPLIAELDRLDDVLAGTQDEVTGAVRFALPPSLGGEIPADIVERCRERHPALGLRVIVALSGAVHESLTRGRLDLGVVYQPIRSKQLDSQELWREKLWFVGPRAAKLRREESVAFREALKVPLVLPAPRHGLRSLVEGYAAREGRELNVAVEVDSLRVLVELVRRGVGHTFLPLRAIERELGSRRISAAPVAKPTLRRVTALAWPKDRPRTRAARAVADIFAEVAAGRRSAQ